MWDLTKVIVKKEMIDEARTKGAKVHFAALMDICHLKHAELETMHQKKVELYSAADAISAYTQVKMEDAPKFLEIPKSECPRHKWRKSWSSMEDPV